MPHRVVCPNCSLAMSVEAAALGQASACPQCRQSFVARVVDDIIDVEFKSADARQSKAPEKPLQIATVKPVTGPVEPTRLPSFPVSDANRTKLNVPALLGKGAWAAGSLVVKAVKFGIAVARKPQPPALAASSAPAVESSSRACPYCGEAILAVAKKCKHCGEFLDGRPNPSAVQHAPPPVVHVAVVNQVTSKSASYANAVAAAAAHAESKTSSGCGGCALLLVTGVLGLAAFAYWTGNLPLDGVDRRKSVRPTVPRPKSEDLDERPSPKAGSQTSDPVIKKPEESDPQPKATEPIPSDDARKNETVAGGLLRSAKVLKADGKDAAAKEWLQKVLDRHPNTEAGKEAAKLVREW